MEGTAQALRTRARKGLAQLPLLARALRLVARAAPRPTAAWAALVVVQGLLPVALVFLTRAAVDALAATLGGGAGWARAREPVLLVAALALVLLLAEVELHMLLLIFTNRHKVSARRAEYQRPSGRGNQKGQR